MKKIACRVMAPVFILSVCALSPLQLAGARDTAITLPQPLPAKTSLLEAMQKRRTTRVFSLQQKLTLQELANLMYAMQGVSAANKRTVPSSMGAYPIELYVAVSRVSGVPDGLYRYVVSSHSLTLLRPGDPSADLAKACFNQASVRQAQIKVIMTSLWERLAGQGENYQRWGYLEAGAIGQNGMVMAAGLGLNSVPVGGFVPAQVAKFLSVDPVKETPVYINCYGR